MKTLIILSVVAVLGWIEILLKPRLDITEDYIFLWYGSERKRDFIRFTKL